MSDARERPTAAADTAGTGGTGTSGTATSNYQQSAQRNADYQEGYAQPAEYESGRRIAAWGLIALAATLMILSGLWSFFVGITAVIKGSFFVRVPNYTFQYSIHGWGWTHLILGAVIFAAGVCLLLGMMWARVVGVILAVLSGLANFLFLPYYPLWSIIVIALDVFIIWALVTGGRRQPA